MIFIVNHKFRIGNQPVQISGGSITERYAQSKLHPRNSATNCPLENNKIYSIHHITREKDKFKYFFEDIETRDIKEMVFNSTTEADDLIARLSGQVEQIKQLRKELSNVMAD